MKHGTNPKILIIEDEPDILWSIEQCMADEGYAIDSASTGDLGLAKACSGYYQAIILDIMLPHTDGLTILERIREEKTTPVLLLTARDDIDDKVKGLDLGADDYLTKPFDIKELKARVRALLRRRGQDKDAFSFSNISIDTVKRQIKKDEQLVSLTAKEYFIIEYLAKHRGDIVSRDTLHELFLSENNEGLSNILDVYISNIRKKLGHDIIKTHRGLGYCVP